jgi:uncharacterized membrane protein
MDAQLNRSNLQTHKLLASEFQIFRTLLHSNFDRMHALANYNYSAYVYSSSRSVAHAHAIDSGNSKFEQRHVA